MSDAVGTVIVGYGLAGRSFHAPLIQRQKGLKLHGVVARDPAVTVQGDLHQRAHLLGVTDIGRHRQRPGQLGGKRLDAVRAPGGQDHLGAPCSHECTGRPADPAGPARHDRDLPPEFLHSPKLALFVRPTAARRGEGMK